jgi:Domain of unknown function (DUF5122) beta-propeller
MTRAFFRTRPEPSSRRTGSDTISAPAIVQECNNGCPGDEARSTGIGSGSDRSARQPRGLSRGRTTGIRSSLVRYLTNGSLDTSLGPAGTGKVIQNMSTATSSDSKNLADWACAVALLPDGKILVVGYSYGGAGTSSDSSLVRDITIGTLDFKHVHLTTVPDSSKETVPESGQLNS